MIASLVTVIFVSIFFSAKANAQSNDSLIHAVLLNIASMQVQQDGEFYAGIFPSFRQCGGAPHNYQPDNNIFYTAVSAFALRNMMPYLSAEDKAIAGGIIAKIQNVYPYYRNRHGYPYYGFWPTSGQIMPHSYFYKYLKQVFGEGEDADDAVIILMTDSIDEETSLALKRRLEAVSNLSSPTGELSPRIRSTGIFRLTALTWEVALCPILISPFSVTSFILFMIKNSFLPNRIVPH